MNSEEELIKKSQNQDPVAFEKLLKNYTSRIYNFLLKMCNNPESAKDISQETLINIYNGINKFKGESKFSTWIFQIASNNCLMLKRKDKKNNFISIHENQLSPLSIIDYKNQPETQFSKQEIKDFINSALQELPAIYRSVFILSELDNFKNKEIATILNISESNVKARRKRAKDKLKKILGPKILQLCCENEKLQVGKCPLDKCLKQILHHQQHPY